jgi:hypothetical protein
MKIVRTLGKFLKWFRRHQVRLPRLSKRYIGWVYRARRRHNAIMRVRYGV